MLINRPGVAGAVLQTALWFIKWVSEWVSQPFPPDIQNIIASKPLELESWYFDRMFTPHHVSCVTCHMSHVTCHVSPVTCHLSPVTCKKNHIFFDFFFNKKKWEKWWSTLRSWLHEIPALIMILSSVLEKNYTLERSSKSFPGMTSMSGFLENCQKHISKS